MRSISLREVLVVAGLAVFSFFAVVAGVMA